MTALARVLHVDDDADIREIARLALEAVGGLEVLSCASGTDALREGPGFRPDLILLDVMMPDLDGPATMQALRRLKELESVPAIFMTAKAGAEEKRDLLGLGAIGVLVKPFDPMTLAAQVRAIWDAAP